ncbi:hypothetical protein L3X38_033253 [Prunus dulcis]|uniref:Uncharacterized protein n=1 Tax=Prunus dulcis TaxID=3755 RepID=A0AAD4VFK8_PRUDU|nr:hypothetical protein L3X38_033253 [Prunus dulcis]
MSTSGNLPSDQLPPPPASYRCCRPSTTTTCCWPTSFRPTAGGGQPSPPPPVNPFPASCHHRRPAAATYRHRPSPANNRCPSPTNWGLTPLPFIHPKKIEEFVSLKGLEP